MTASGALDYGRVVLVWTQNGKLEKWWPVKDALLDGMQLLAG